MINPLNFPVDAVALAESWIADDPSLNLDEALPLAEAMLDELDDFAKAWAQGRRQQQLDLAAYARAWDAMATAQGNPWAFWRP
jgi:hypothetical protein